MRLFGSGVSAVLESQQGLDAVSPVFPRRQGARVSATQLAGRFLDAFDREREHALCADNLPDQVG